jgi:hypothetical protein
VSESRLQNTCLQCKAELAPRAKSGGKAKRFCNDGCRQRFNRFRISQPVEEKSQPVDETFDTVRLETPGAIRNLPAIREPQPEKPEQTSPSTPAEDDFDWNNDDSVIIRETKDTAVYFNKHSALVIRQRGWPDDDTFIIIAEGQITDFLDKLTDACGWGGAIDREAVRVRP